MEQAIRDAILEFRHRADSATAGQAEAYNDAADYLEELLEALADTGD